MEAGNKSTAWWGACFPAAPAAVSIRLVVTARASQLGHIFGVWRLAYVVRVLLLLGGNVGLW